MQFSYTMNKITTTFVFIILFVITLTAVSAQSQVDTDYDGIRDSSDKCLNTPRTVGIPTITRNPEFIGCSCNQIRELIDVPDCANMVCSAGTELSIFYKEEPYKITCSETYCDGYDLYDFPEPTQEDMCREGKKQKTECVPVITKDSESCKRNLYPQLKDLNKEEPEIVEPEQILEEENLDLENIYETYRNQPSLSQLSKADFNTLVESSDNYAILEEKTLQEEKDISGIQTEVLKKQIKVKPIDGYYLKNIVILEKINQELDFNQLIFEQEPLIIDNEQNVVVWQIDTIEEERTISYSLPSTKELDSKTYVISEYAKKTNYSFWIIIAVAVFILVMTFIWLKKDVKNKRERE